MQSTRLLFVLVAVFVAAAIVQLVLSNANDKDPAFPGGESPAVSTGADWDLHQRPRQPAPGTAADPIDREKFEQLMEHERGTRVEHGQEVDVTPMYRPGTVSQYRHVFTSTTRPREGGATAGWRRSDGLTVTVLEPDAKGRTRVRVEQDWFLYQTLAGPMNSWEFDSRSPDEALLAQPNVSGIIRPLLAIQDAPLEFTLDEAGYAIAVDGVEEQRNRCREAMEQLGGTRIDQFLPTDEQRLMEYRGSLFPHGLGGTLKAGRGRKYSRREDTGMLAYVTFDGKLHVTHDDPDTFAVETRDTRSGLERTGGDRLPNGRQIADLRIPPNGTCVASWVFDRKAGHLRTARVHTRYECWVSLMSGDASGDNAYEPHFLIVEQLRTLDPIVAVSEDE